MSIVGAPINFCGAFFFFKHIVCFIIIVETMMSNQSLPSIHGTHIGTIYTNRSVNGISACIWFSQLNWFLLCCSFASAAPGAPSRDRYTVDQPGPSHLPGGTGGWVHAKDGAGNPRVYSTAHPFKGGGQGQTWEAQGEKRRASHIYVISCLLLTHRGRMMHICGGNITIICSDNGLAPGWCQAIIWINAGILLIGPLGTNFSEILIAILIFSFKKMRLKGSSVKWRSFCLSLNVLKWHLYEKFS